MKIRVYHSYYGCDTGCCGHIVELDGGREQFEFEHSYEISDTTESLRAWAIGFAKRVVKKEWPECYDSVDWESVDVSEVLND